MSNLMIVNQRSFIKQTLFYRLLFLNKLKKMSNTKTVFTQYNSHCADIVKQNPEAESIIVAGGDGTIHEAINTMDFSRQKLTIIPIGRGNSLARDLKIRRYNFLKQNFRSQEKDISLIEVELDNSNIKRYAFSTCGCCATVKIVKDAASIFKRWGWLSYAMATMKKINNYYTQTIDCSFDNKHYTLDVSAMIINNTKHCGPFKMFPNACVRTPGFETLTFKKPHFTDFFVVLNAKHSSEQLLRNKIDSLELKSEQAFSVMLDGEIFDDQHSASFKSSKNILKLMV